MAKEQVLKSLELADESLRRAIAELVEMRFGVPQCRGPLGETVENLRVAVAHADAAPELSVPELRKTIQRIRAQAVRAQLLLDSAAAFYCGWTSAAPAGPPSYAPDGQILRDRGSGRLRLNA
jgi:hypothetical protein